MRIIDPTTGIGDEIQETRNVPGVVSDLLGRWRIRGQVRYGGVLYNVCVGVDGAVKNMPATLIFKQVVKGVVVLVRPEEMK